MAVEARAQAEGARLSRQALSRWFQLEPGEFLNTEGDWIAVRQDDGRIDKLFLEEYIQAKLVLVWLLTGNYLQLKEDLQIQKGVVTSRSNSLFCVWAENLQLGTGMAFSLGSSPRSVRIGGIVYLTCVP